MPWRKTSSAARKASSTVTSGPQVSSRRSLGMTMSVSTRSRRPAMPSSACWRRFVPSNPKGLVTTATVSAPTSRATDATSGEAPVPVPPPMPAVMNTISAPRRASRSSSPLSSAGPGAPLGAPPPSPRQEPPRQARESLPQRPLEERRAPLRPPRARLEVANGPLQHANAGGVGGVAQRIDQPLDVAGRTDAGREAGHLLGERGDAGQVRRAARQHEAGREDVVVDSAPHLAHHHLADLLHAGLHDLGDAPSLDGLAPLGAEHLDLHRLLGVDGAG